MPSPDFPTPPSDALMSDEPADVETPLRRGYFTDLDREEVMQHYLSQFDETKLLDISILAYRLNYPPEEAQTLIRDQTRSTFLEEIVHPFRESVFINGFEPTEDRDLIRVGGKLWRQKIIVRYYPSDLKERLAVGILVSLLGIFVLETTFNNTKKLFNR